MSRRRKQIIPTPGPAEAEIAAEVQAAADEIMDAPPSPMQLAMIVTTITGDIERVVKGVLPAADLPALLRRAAAQLEECLQAPEC